MEREPNYHQSRASELQHQIHNGEGNLACRVEKYREETSEALRLVAGMTAYEINLLADTAYFSDELSREVVDSIIAGLGILTDLGKNFDEMFDEQIDKAKSKYNPSKIQVYVDQGMSRAEAIARVKADYSLEVL